MTERYTNAVSEETRGSGLELGGRKVDLVTGIGSASLGSVSLYEVITNLASISQSLNSLPNGQREIAEIMTYGSPPFLILAGAGLIVDYLRANEKLPQNVSKRIGEIGQKVERIGTSLGLAAAGIGAAYFATDTLLTKDFPSRDFMDGAARAITVGVAMAGSLALFTGAAVVLAEDESHVD